MLLHFYFLQFIFSLTDHEVAEISELALIQLRQHLANQRIVFNQRIDQFKNKLNENSVRIKEIYKENFDDLNKMTEGYEEFYDQLREFGKQFGLKRKYTQNSLLSSFNQRTGQTVPTPNVSFYLSANPTLGTSLINQPSLNYDPFRERRSFEVSNVPSLFRRMRLN